MVTRTAKGTASSKTSGATLTIPSFTVPAGHSLVVGATYDNAQAAPTSVKHSGRDLNRRQQQDNASRSIHSSMWVKGEYHKEQTGTCVLTWASAIVERAAFATSLDLAIRKDDGAGNEETASVANPGTGRTGALLTAGAFVVGTRYEIVTVGTTDFTLIGAASNTVGLLFVATGVGSGTGTAREALSSATAFVICCFGAEGPVEDTAGTAQIRDNGSLATATVGQRAGTTGGTGPTNITVQETFLELTTQHYTRGVINGATSRRWVNTLLAMEERLTLGQQGVSISDIINVEAIVAAAGGNVNDIFYGFNEATGEYEAFEIASPGAAVARYDSVDGWVVP